MFDIGFWEIMLISIIGLVVLGPQRLPIAIRSVLKWINTAKGMANSVKSEISQELKLHEMNENMIKASQQGLDVIEPGLQASIDEMKKSTSELTRPYQKNTDDILNEKDNKVTSTTDNEPKLEEKSQSVTSDTIQASTTAPQQEK